MSAGRTDRGPVRIRRRGRHTTPTQVEKVALQAGKAAPAVAIAGALVAAPQASHALAAATVKPAPATTQAHAATAKAADAATSTATATLDSVSTRTVTVTAAKPARHAATTRTTTYRVRSGDTLSGIARKFFHNGDWQYLYHVNEKTISNPNMIYVGEELRVPASAPEHYALTGYTPRHAKPTTEKVSRTRARSGSTSHGGGTTVVVQTARLGHYSCSALEQLWDEAGGNRAEAFTAAEIAMAESGGNPNAISPTDDFGLWQINGVHGSLATLNPFGNARAAIIVSDDGRNWSPWTTYTSGRYFGQC